MVDLLAMSIHHRYYMHSDPFCPLSTTQAPPLTHDCFFPIVIKRGKLGLYKIRSLDIMKF